MSIEFHCSSCGKLLRVAGENAHRKVECPACNSICELPESATAESAAPQEDQWRVRTPEGEVYGPVDKAELDGWLGEGRLSASCQVMNTGATDWKPAVEVYPSLGSTAGATGAGVPSQYTPPSDNPYASPAAHDPGRFVAPHRGGLILAFGILGFAVCVLFGVAAWIMGRNDMNAMNAGIMDKSGYGLTQAGHVLGIIATLFLIIPLILVFFYFVIVVLVAAGGGF